MFLGLSVDATSICDFTKPCKVYKKDFALKATYQLVMLFTNLKINWLKHEDYLLNFFYRSCERIICALYLKRNINNNNNNKDNKKIRSPQKQILFRTKAVLINSLLIMISSLIWSLRFLIFFSNFQTFYLFAMEHLDVHFHYNEFFIIIIIIIITIVILIIVVVITLYFHYSLLKA